jgi:predicted DCC family thiol-disulfide oxidoreductase YuxK
MTGRKAPVPRAPFSYRGDPAVPPFPDDRPIIVFDGQCVLCSGFAQFILRHDKHHRFRLLAAQTPLGAALYRHFGLDPVDYETNILIEQGRAWLKSEGSIRIFVRLGFPWSLTAVGWLVPLAVRDRLYEQVARNRYRWFGIRQTCYLPDPSEADRFLA